MTNNENTVSNNEDLPITSIVPVARMLLDITLIIGLSYVLMRLTFPTTYTAWENIDFRGGFLESGSLLKAMTVTFVWIAGILGISRNLLILSVKNFENTLRNEKVQERS